MPDTAGPGLPQPDDGQLSHTLTIHEVGDRLAAAGVPRSERQIKRYCESAFLDAKKIPGPSGDQWFVAPAALPKLIGDLQQWQMQRHGQTGARPAVANPVHPENSIQSAADMPGLGLPQPDTSAPSLLTAPVAPAPDTAGYVRQLEKRIEDKDDVIGMLKGQLTAKDQQITDLSTRFGNLSDRFADTQKLLGAMQRMFAPLLGQGDPYSASEPAQEPRQADNP